MVDEIKRLIEEQKVFFGIKESLKKSGEIDKAILSSDCRDEVKNLLSANKVKFEISDLSKNEISSRLGLSFKCEVFGLQK